MRQTSLEAYNQLRREQVLGYRQKVVLETLKKLRKATDSEISLYLGYTDKNMIRPRRNELMKQGFVKEIERRRCNVTGRKAIVWGLS